MRMRSVAWALLLVVGCSPSGAVPGSPPAVASTSATPLATAPSVADPTTAVPSGPPGSDAPATGTSGIALVPDPAADHTLGETITISGGESVGDQANLTVLQAIRRAERSPLGAPEYAFLVEIEGLDPDTVPFNSLYFTLLDDQDFRYDAASGRQQPELRFGDLPKGRKVKGWLTFSGPETAAHLELEFAPVFALEPVYVRVRLP